MFEIHMGVPEMAAFWDALQERVRSEKASKAEVQQYKRIGKALLQLSTDPRYPGLRSHEVVALTVRYGQKVWESYLQNNTSGAERLFWVYGPGKGDITIIGLEPHPDDKRNAYQKITLSAMGENL